MRASGALGSCCKTVKYFALATAIVAVALAVVTSLRLARRPAGDSHYSSAAATPGPPQRQAAVAGLSEAAGDAPWALSALPECFRQVMHAHGSIGFAHAKIPPAARRITSGETFAIADCTVEIRGDDVRVSRGSEHLRVPPLARLYRNGERQLVLERQSGNRDDVRLYDLVPERSERSERSSRRKAAVP